MPIYEYRCGSGHIHEDIRAYQHRNRRTHCPRCKRLARLIPSAHHAEVDGIYSYAPNVGSATAFDRKNQAIAEGKKVIDKVLD